MLMVFKNGAPELYDHDQVPLSDTSLESVAGTTTNKNNFAKKNVQTNSLTTVLYFDNNSRRYQTIQYSNSCNLPNTSVQFMW